MQDLETLMRPKEVLFQRVVGAGGVSLKTFPAVITRILSIIADPESSAKDLTTVISMDPALTARVLTVVNSPYYGFSSRIASLNHAVVILGYDNVKNIALGVSVFHLFKRADRGHLVRIWKHAICCAIFSRILAKRIRLPAYEEAFVAGLLHDVGKIVLCDFNPKAFNMAYYTYLHEKQKLNRHFEAEEKMLGIHHGHIGGFVTREWKLPKRLSEAIFRHHDLLVGSMNLDHTTIALVKVLQLANQISWLMGFPSVDFTGGYSHEETVSMLDPSLYETLSLTQEEMGVIVRELEEGLGEVRSYFEMIERP